MKKIFLCVIALVLLGLAAWLAIVWIQDAAVSPHAGDAAARRVSTGERVPNQTRQAAASPVVPAAAVSPHAGDAAARRVSTGERVLNQTRQAAASPVVPAAADEAAVESFDKLTDKWMEPSKKDVTMADVDAFVAQFKKVPRSRQEECLQRALNLVPDENVMLLAGVLMDKSQPKELVELVFNDILNRDEDVKKPILQQVFKDKTHPCWADTAWILDVTGETPTATSAP